MKTPGTAATVRGRRSISTVTKTYNGKGKNSTDSVLTEIKREADRDIKEGLRLIVSAYTGDLNDTAKIQRIDTTALVALQGLLASNRNLPTHGLEHAAFKIAGRFEEARTDFFSGVNKTVNRGLNWGKRS